MQLGGFDMSALVDTGWRMASGQTPYVDFPLTTPVAFYIGAGWALQLFGAKWSSFVIAAILFTVFSFIAQLYLLNLILSWKRAWAISFVSQLLCSVIASYWWYNAMTMNTVCLFLSAAYVFAHMPEKRVSSVSLWVTLTLLALMKPNIAGGLAMLVFIALFAFSPHRGRIFLIGVAALVAFFAILFLLKISPSDVIQSYIAIGKGRAMPTLRWFYNDKPYERLVVLPLIVLALLPMLERISRFTPQQNTPTVRLDLSITVASVIMGCLSLLTNSDSNLTVGIPFFLLGSTIFYFLTETNSILPVPRKLWQYLAMFCFGFAAVGSSVIQANYHAKDGIPNMLGFWYILAILCIMVAFFFILIKDDPKNKISLPVNWNRDRVVWATLLICGGIAMYAGGMRWRVSYIGYESFFTYSPLTKVEGIPFFDDFQISPTAKTTMLEIQQVLQTNYGSSANWSRASVYFGTRIEFAYAAFGILSPRNMPIWWHPNNSYSPEREPEYAQSFIDHHFEDAIFMKSPDQNEPDFGFLPDVVLADLLSNYDRVDYSSIVVFHKK